MEPLTLSNSEPRKKPLNCGDSENEGEVITMTGIWRDFLQETSLHGCKNVLRTRQWMATRIVWIALLIGMCLALGFTLLELWLSYRKYPVKTVYSLRVENSVPLPAVTFCLPSKIDVTRLDTSSPLYAYLNLNSNLTESGDKIEDMSMAEFNNMTAFKLGDVFKFIANETHSIPEEEWDSWIRPVPNSLKACWTFNWDYSKKLKVSANEWFTFILDAKSGHFPRQVVYSGIDFTLHDSQSTYLAATSYFLQPGTMTRINFDTTENKYLPPPYKSFGSDGCREIDYDTIRNPFKLWPRYSKTLCILENIINIIIKTCKCVDPQYSDIRPDVPECTLKTMHSCAIPLYFKSYNTQSMTTTNHSGCPQECSFNVYEVRTSAANFPSGDISLLYPDYDKTKAHARDTLLLVSLHPKSSVIHVVEHVPEMTLLTIFGTVGGYMGLFLGASVLTLTEFFETCLICLWLVVSKVIFRRRDQP